MSCTEKQAKDKWCPQMGRDHSPVVLGNCMGSKCMAWRWTEEPLDGPDSYQAEPGPQGYCGRAGKPIGVK